MPIPGGHKCHPRLGLSHPNPPAAYILLPIFLTPFSSEEPRVVKSFSTLTRSTFFPAFIFLVISNSNGAKKPSCVPTNTPFTKTLAR